MSTSRQCSWGDRMDLIGIENEAEFLPSGTLSDVLKEYLLDVNARWSGLDKEAHPVERLASIAAPTVEALRQVRNASDAGRRQEVARKAHHDLLGALGYSWKREAVATALNRSPPPHPDSDRFPGRGRFRTGRALGRRGATSGRAG